MIKQICFNFQPIFTYHTILSACFPCNHQHRIPCIIIVNLILDSQSICLFYNLQKLKLRVDEEENNSALQKYKAVLQIVPNSCEMRDDKRDDKMS